MDCNTPECLDETDQASKQQVAQVILKQQTRIDPTTKCKPPGNSMVGSEGNVQQIDVTLRSLRFVVSGACDGAC